MRKVTLIEATGLSNTIFVEEPTGQVIMRKIMPWAYSNQNKYQLTTYRRFKFWQMGENDILLYREEIE